MTKAKAKPKWERTPIDFSRPGRYLNGTKRGPEGHVCVFNANLCTKTEGKFWFGDLDLDSDERDDLIALAKAKGEDVYVLREHDARFMNEGSPRLENAVRIYTPYGTVIDGKPS